MGWAGPPTKDDVPTDAERLRVLKERAANWAEPFRPAMLWVEEGTPMPVDYFNYWEPVEWHNRSGRVTLAVDAAHPMPPCTIEDGD